MDTDLFLKLANELCNELKYYENKKWKETKKQKLIEQIKQEVEEERIETKRRKRQYSIIFLLINRCEDLIEEYGEDIIVMYDYRNLERVCPMLTRSYDDDNDYIGDTMHCAIYGSINVFTEKEKLYIKDFIKILENIREKYGDLPVRLGNVYHINKIEYIPKEESTFTNCKYNVCNLMF